MAVRSVEHAGAINLVWVGRIDPVSLGAMASLYSELHERLQTAFTAVAGESVDPVLRRSQRADFQADGALAVARKAGKNPREFAAEVVAHATLDDLCSVVEIAGPGFINLTVRDEAVSQLAQTMAADERLGVPLTGSPDTVVVDYSGPNAAKEMHVGHLRSTIIGDSVVRLLEFRGHTVIRQNHLGEWGTPFGMLVEHLLDIGETEAAHELSVGDLGAFYKAARQKFEADEAFQDRSRQRVVLLQGGDEATLRLWRILVEQSQGYFLAVYALLAVRLTADDFAGESMYNSRLAAIAEELDELGLLKESDGALCVFPAGYKNREGDPLPLIVRKRDGGYGYDTTDLAAIRYRALELKGTRLLYVIGMPQHTHLQMVFDTGRDAGWVSPSTRVEHIGFGSILGEDGKMLRSRAGESVKLISLLDEAVSRAAEQVKEKNPSLEPVQAEAIARSVGIGAVKYADLSTDRTKDYVFDYTRMLSFDGNTAPYLQYAHARIHSILRKGGVSLSEIDGTIDLREPQERELAMALLGVQDLLVELDDNLEFHKLCTYLFALAASFTSFYEHCPVLRSEADVRASRLTLCALTARVLALGLDLLGIDAPEQM
jgi:arginyl-tRNA synthetase